MKVEHNDIVCSFGGSSIDCDICDAIVDVLGLQVELCHLFVMEEDLSELYCSWIYIFHVTVLRRL